jgi:hypothetical protein
MLLEFLSIWHVNCDIGLENYLRFISNPNLKAGRTKYQGFIFEAGMVRVNEGALVDGR